MMLGAGQEWQHLPEDIGPRAHALPLLGTRQLMTRQPNSSKTLRLPMLLLPIMTVDTASVQWWDSCSIPRTLPSILPHFLCRLTSWHYLQYICIVLYMQGISFVCLDASLIYSLVITGNQGLNPKVPLHEQKTFVLAKFGGLIWGDPHRASSTILEGPLMFRSRYGGTLGVCSRRRRARKIHSTGGALPMGLQIQLKVTSKHCPVPHLVTAIQFQEC